MKICREESRCTCLLYTSLLAYTKGNVRNNLMKVCLVINSLYAAGGIAAFCMMAVTKLS